MDSVVFSVIPKKKVYSLEEYLFTVGFMIIIISKGFGVYDGQVAFKISFTLAIFLIALKILIEGRDVFSLIFRVVLLALIFVGYRVTDNKGYVIIGVILFGMRNMNIKNLLHLGGICAAVSMTSSYAITCLNLYVGDMRLTSKIGGLILRYSFGNPHPNSMHMMYVVMSICILYSAVDSNKELIHRNLLLTCGSVLLFIFTLSYTGLVLSLIIFFSVHYHCHAPQVMYLFEKTGVYMMVFLCILFSTIFPFALIKSPVAYERVNHILNNRLNLIIDYIKAYNVGFWPKRINDYSKINYQLDNSFTLLLIEGGIVIFCIFVVLLLLTINSLIKNNNRLAIIFIGVQIIGGLSDPFLFNSSARNFIILWMGEYLYEGLLKSTNTESRLERWLIKQEMNLSLWEIELKFNCKKMKKTVVVALVLACLITVCMSILTKWPQAYAININKYEAGAQSLENSFGDKIVVYDNVKNDDSIKVYNVMQPEDKVILLDDERTLMIEKTRISVLRFINSFGMVMIISMVLQKFNYNIFRN